LRNAVLTACAAGGLAQTAPEGLVPLDTHSSPAGGDEGGRQTVQHIMTDKEDTEPPSTRRFYGKPLQKGEGGESEEAI